MDARAFASALYGFTDLLQRSSEVLLGDRERIAVQVDAKFQQGSFEFLLVIAAAVGNQTIKGTLEQLQLITNAIGITGDFDNSFFGIIAKLRGLKVTKIEPAPEGRAHVHVQGDNNIIIVNDQAVAKLLLDENVRRAAKAITQPVDGTGVTSLQIGKGTASRPPLLSNDTDTIKALPAPTTVLTDSTVQTALEIISPNFKDENKWRVAQGGEAFWVTIEDKAFLASMDMGRPFVKGDYLIVQMRTLTTATPQGLFADRYVMVVEDQRRRSLPQQSLFDTPSPGET